MRILSALLLLLASSLWASAQPIPYGPTTMVSALPSGSGPPGGLGWALSASVSDDGRRVAFESDYGYDPLDSNQVTDIYLFDQDTQAIHLISRGLQGQAVRGSSPKLSRDGTRLLFTCRPNLLVPGELGQVGGSVLADLSNLSAITYRRLDRRFDLAPITWTSYYSSATPDLDYVVYVTREYLTPPAPGETSAPSLEKVYLVRSSDHFTVRVSDYCGPLKSASGGKVSDDGRFVAYETDCVTSLAADTNGVGDAFVKDLWLGTQQILSASLQNGVFTAIGGTVVTFSGDGSTASICTDPRAFFGPSFPAAEWPIIYDLATGSTEPFPWQFPGETCIVQAISQDGRRFLVSAYTIPFPGNGVLALVDRSEGTIEILNRLDDGIVYGQGIEIQQPSWSHNGRWVSGMANMDFPYSPWVIWMPRPPNNCFRIDLGPGLNLGGASAGSAGKPEFRIVEGLSAPGTWLLTVRGAPPGAQALLALGTNINPNPLAGGMAWSWPPESVWPYTMGVNGGVVLEVALPPMLPPGFEIIGQWGIADAGAPLGLALTNGVKVGIP